MNRKQKWLALLCAATMGLFVGCTRADDPILTAGADRSVNLIRPYTTVTPVPETGTEYGAVTINANGSVVLNDKSLLSNSNATASELNAYSTLRLGDTGIAVQALQQRLRELGYFTETASGIFDAATQTAVHRFEQTFDVMQTGIATPAFQAKLFAADAPAYGTGEYENAVVSQYTVLQKGSVGSSVYALQRRLKRLGYPLKTLTGVFDDDTLNALHLFYKAYGLEIKDIAYVSIQREIYSEDARPYTVDGKAQTVEDDSTLSLGNVGTLVMQIQERLELLGYLHTTATGIFDTQTEAAVRKFQEACGVEVTGRLDYSVQAVLMSEQAPAFGSTYKEQQTNYDELAEGSVGDAVLALQSRLIALGYANGTGNGSYGTATVNAVRMFQHYNNLEETGIATNETQSALYSPLALSYKDVLNGVTVQITPTPAPAQVTPVPKSEFLTEEALEEMEILTEGMGGNDVINLQTRLKGLGFDCSVTGVYDGDTVSAVKALQAAIGAAQTGEATASFQKYLYCKGAPNRGIWFYAETQSFKTLRLNDLGESVTALQQTLWKYGFLAYEDVANSIGSYNQATADAVSAAQKALGYAEPDGVASEEFQCFLFSQYGSNLK